jgi:hypothetical protein
MAALFRLLAHVAKSKDIPDEHKQILLTDIKSNRARDAVRASAAYLDYIGADSEPAERLVASGMPEWVVHAEKGDGGLTESERATLDLQLLLTRPPLEPGQLDWLERGSLIQQATPLTMAEKRGSC